LDFDVCISISEDYITQEEAGSLEGKPMLTFLHFSLAISRDDDPGMLPNEDHPLISAAAKGVFN